MRLAGTCKRYSKNAIPQLTKMTNNKGLLLKFFKRPYQAKVINKFEKKRNVTVVNTVFPSPLKLAIQRVIND